MSLDAAFAELVSGTPEEEDDIEEADSGDTDAAADMLMPGFDPSKSKGGK